VLLSASVPYARAQDVSRRAAQTSDIFAIDETYPSGPTQPSRARPDFQGLDDGYAAPGIPPPMPQSDPTEDPQEQDLLDPSPRAGQRAVVEDGDLNYPGEPVAPVDGVLDTPEEAALEDGIDPLVVDTRDADDVALFQNPPAPPDPLLYQIEDLDPIRDNRTA